MQKEIEPIQQLEAKKERLSHIIGQRESLVGRIGTGAVRFESSADAARKIGRVAVKVEESITTLNSRLSQVDQELRAYEEAPKFLNNLNQKRQEVIENSKSLARGTLSEDEFNTSYQQFQDLLRLQEQNPFLKRSVERLQQEEKKKKEETKPLIEILPDGKVRLPNGREVGGKPGEALRSLNDTSKDNTKTTDQLVQEIWPGIEEKAGRGRLNVHLSKARIELIGSGLDLVNITPPIERTQGATGRYYLGRVDQDEQPPKTVEPEQAADKSDEGFKFEDVQVITGEEGKILNRLSPFDPHHIISRQELMRELLTEDTPIDPQTFDQHLREVGDILDWKRYRVAELPNPKDPDNKDKNGYYVETVRKQQVNITLLGDTVRYRERNNQTEEVKLSEPQYRLLWQLSSGKPRLDKELVDKVSDVPNDPAFYFGNLDLVRATAGSLNSKLTDLTNAEGIVISVGDENFGNWYKIKDARIARRLGYLPLHSTRKEALKLIFQDNPSTTKEEIINTLGPTRGIKRISQPLNSYQAAYALRNSVRSLSNRTRENIATDDETTLYQEMQDYMAKHNLTDQRGLAVHISDKLGIVRKSLSTSDDSSADVIDVTAEDTGYIEEVDLGEVGEEILAPSIETSEFGSLSKVDVALIAETLQFNRALFEPLLQERGVRLIEEDVIYELMGLIEGQESELQEQYSKGLLSADELSQLMNDYKARVFGKAKEMLSDPNFDEISEGIGDKNPNVWGLLVNLSEIDETIKRAGREEGITLIAQDPEILKTVLENPENEDGTIEDDLEVAVVDGSTIVFEAPAPAPALGTESVEPKVSVLERRDPEIRATINQYLDRILEIPELNGPVSPPLVTRSFESIKKPFIDHALEEGWISAIRDRNHKDHLEYDTVAIATLLYLHRNEDKLNSRLKKKVQDIAEEEYRKRLKEKENNK